MNRVRILALSGPSCSGKTSIARVLKSILPECDILHQDDFYKDDADIPVGAEELQDWDCPEAFNMDSMISAIQLIKTTGAFPENFVSKEDKNYIPPPQLQEDEINKLRERFLAQNPSISSTKIVIVDGIMLFHEHSTLLDYFDLRVLIRASYQELKARREKRKGYVTVEGFWEDPPGYFDKIVWPQYVKHHSYLFERNSVDADINSSAKALGITDFGVDAPMKQSVEKILGFLQHLL